jgi:spore germination protein GerM
MSVQPINGRPAEAGSVGTAPAPSGGGDRNRNRWRWIAAGAGAVMVGALVVTTRGDDRDDLDVAVEETTTVIPTTGAPTTTAIETPSTQPDGGAVAPTAPATTATSSAEGLRLTIWFIDSEVEGVPVEVTVPPTDAVARAAMTELLKGTGGGGQYATSIPAGTRLLDLGIEDGVATVDLSREFGSGGGSASMQARVAQVVYTLTELDTVDAVTFWMEGEPVGSLGGEGLILDGPTTRADWASFAP